MVDSNLSYLHEVATRGSMRAAADSLGIAVSSISRQIASLERQMGLAVLERGRRSAKLTEAGRLLLEFHRERLTQNDRLEERLANLRGSRAGRVEVVVGEGFVGEVLAGMLGTYATRHPGIIVDASMTTSSNDVSRMIAEDEAHIGLAFHPAPDPRIRIAGSAIQGLRAVTRPGHPIARSASVRLSDLGAFRLCLPESAFRTRQLLRGVEIAEQCALHPCITSNSIGLLKTLVRRCDFVTILPELAVHEEVDRGDVVAVPIASAWLPDTSIHVLTRVGRQLSPAALTLCRELVEFLRGCVARVQHARRVHVDREESVSRRMLGSPASSKIAMGPVPSRADGSDLA